MNSVALCEVFQWWKHLHEPASQPMMVNVINGWLGNFHMDVIAKVLSEVIIHRQRRIVLLAQSVLASHCCVLFLMFYNNLLTLKSCLIFYPISLHPAAFQVLSCMTATVINVLEIFRVTEGLCLKLLDPGLQPTQLFTPLYKSSPKSIPQACHPSTTVFLIKL